MEIVGNGQGNWFFEMPKNLPFFRAIGCSDDRYCEAVGQISGLQRGVELQTCKISTEQVYLACKRVQSVTGMRVF